MIVSLLYWNDWDQDGDNFYVFFSFLSLALSIKLLWNCKFGSLKKPRSVIERVRVVMQTSLQTLTVILCVIRIMLYV